MDPNWKKWFKWQWAETKKYFDLKDPTRRNPPLLVYIGGGLLLLVVACLIWG